MARAESSFSLCSASEICLDTLVAYFAPDTAAQRRPRVIVPGGPRRAALVRALAFAALSFAAVSFAAVPFACSDFEGYGVDAGAGGSSGSGGSAGSAGSAGEPDAGVVDSGATVADAGGDADATVGDAEAPLDAAPSDAGLPERYASCQAICDTQADLQDCAPPDNCVENLCGEVAIAALPPDCVDENDAYNECLATEPVDSFICSGDTPLPSIGNNGCPEEECAFFTCLGVPNFCSL
jgi:hypothetical protein